MNTYSKDILDSYWSSGKRIIHDGKKYRVGKMSYSDYFFEPGEPKGETEPFNKGTLWLEKVENKHDLFTVEETLD
jgi:hypothetical protein